jgi:hypothetical protein
MRLSPFPAGIRGRILDRDELAAATEVSDLMALLELYVRREQRFGRVSAS